MVRDCIIFKSIHPATSKAAFRSYCIFPKACSPQTPTHPLGAIHLRRKGSQIWRDLGHVMVVICIVLVKYLVWTLATHCCSSRSWFPRQTCIAILTLKYELAQSRSTINFYRFKQNKSALSGTFVRAETHPPTLMLVPVTCACVHELSEVGRTAQTKGIFSSIFLTFEEQEFRARRSISWLRYPSLHSTVHLPSVRLVQLAHVGRNLRFHPAV